MSPTQMHLTRRQVIGSGMGITAGLLGLGPLAGRTVIAQDGGTEIHTAWPYLDPESGGHFNNFVTQGILNPPNIYGDLMFIPMGLLMWATSEWIPLLAESWEFTASGSATASAASPAANADLDTFVVKLRQGVIWSDDKPVTSADVVATFDCLWLMSNTVWTYIDQVDAVDEYTVSFHMSTPSLTVERYVIRRSTMPAAIYGEWATKARALRDQGLTSEAPEFKQLLDEFNKFRPENIIVNGPYTIDQASITNAQFNMPKNEKSFWADQAKFDRIVNYNGETDTITAVVLSKEIDYATHGFPPATEGEFAANGIRTLRPPTYGGGALMFNFGKCPEFLDKKVRQALAQALSRDENATITYAQSGKAPEYMAGIADASLPKWLSEESIAKLNTYPYDVAAAEAGLTAAGWSKVDGKWKKPDGSDAKYAVSHAAEFADTSACARNVVEQLNAFGFDVADQPITFTQYPIDLDQGKFELGIEGWGSSSNPHPRFSYETAFFNRNTLAINNGGKGTEFPLLQQTDVAGEVDIEQLVRDSALGMDESLQKEQVTTLALVFNELLNIIPLYERYGNNAALEGVRVKAWPADDDPILQNSPYADGIPTILILTGKLEPFTGQ